MEVDLQFSDVPVAPPAGSAPLRPPRILAFFPRILGAEIAPAPKGMTITKIKTHEWYANFYLAKISSTFADIDHFLKKRIELNLFFQVPLSLNIFPFFGTARFLLTTISIK